MLLLCVAKVVMTRRVSHAPFASSSNKNLGHSCKWAPSRAFSSVPFDSQQEECQCQCQHPCQHSQPHSPPNIFLFIFFFNFQYSIPINVITIIKIRIISWSQLSLKLCESILTSITLYVCVRLFWSRPGISAHLRGLIPFELGMTL